MINRAGPRGTLVALRQSAPSMIPVGAGALVGPEGGSPLGLADDGVRPPDPPGVQLDAVLDGLDARLTALVAHRIGRGRSMTRVDWGNVFGGSPGDAFLPGSWVDRETERIKANEGARKDYDEAWSDEERWPHDSDGRRYDPRALSQRLAREGWPGQVFGNGMASCPQCTAEQRAAESGQSLALDVFDHEHWRSDRRLEARLYSMTRIAQAEAYGEIQMGNKVDPVTRRIVA